MTVLKTQHQGNHWSRAQPFDTHPNQAAATATGNISTSSTARKPNAQFRFCDRNPDFATTYRSRHSAHNHVSLSAQCTQNITPCSRCTQTSEFAHALHTRTAIHNHSDQRMRSVPRGYTMSRQSRLPTWNLRLLMHNPVIFLFFRRSFNRVKFSIRHMNFP